MRSWDKSVLSNEGRSFLLTETTGAFDRSLDSHVITARTVSNSPVSSLIKTLTYAPIAINDFQVKNE